MPKNIEIRNSTAEFLIFMLEGKEDGIQVTYKNETIWATQKAMAQLEAGLINADQFHRLIREKYNLSLSDDVIDDAFYRFLLDIPKYKMDLIRRLHNGVYNANGNKIRILVLSNTNEIQFPYCIRKFFNVDGDSVEKYFDHLYLSYEMKMTKPSEEIFLKLLSDEGIKPEEAVFLDDGPANVETARRLGMQVYHVMPNENYSKLFDDILV